MKEGEGGGKEEGRKRRKEGGRERGEREGGRRQAYLREIQQDAPSNLTET